MLSIQNKARVTTIGFFAVLALISMLILATQVSARISSTRGDNVVEQAVAEDVSAFKMTLPALTAATSTVLVDLSDTTNFKHIPTSGGIEVFKLRFDWSTQVIATTTIRVGVIASTTPAGNLVDVYWFDEVSFTSSSLAGLTDQSGRQSAVIDYLPSVLKARVASGVPSHFTTNAKDTSSPKYATTTSYTSPRGLFTVTPNVGDLVMEIYDQKGTATTSVSGLYRVTE